jgi:hypothetical protein
MCGSKRSGRARLLKDQNMPTKLHIIPITKCALPKRCRAVVRVVPPVRRARRPCTGRLGGKAYRFDETPLPFESLALPKPCHP